MRVKLSRPQSYIPEFNDNKLLPENEQIKADLTPLKLGDFLDLAECFQRAGAGQQQVDTARLSVAQMKEVILSAGRLLPTYAVIHGLIDETGQPLTINEVGTQPAFIPLSVELLGKLSEISAPTEGDAKN